MPIQVILAAIGGLIASVALVAVLIGAYKPDVRAVYIQTCIILLWVLVLVISQAEEPTNTSHNTTHADAIAK